MIRRTGMRKKEIAKLLGITPNSLTRKIGGARRVSDADIERLAEIVQDKKPQS